MPDHFATLAMPRRPWLEPDVVKDAFHRLAGARHPDAPGGDAGDFAALNAAWQVLRDPAPRLRHLLELEYPDALAQGVQVPLALSEIFMRLAPLRQAGEEFARRKRAASGALGQALLAGDGLALERDLRAALAQLDALHAQALAELRDADAQWPARDAATGARFAALQQRFVFLGKWSAQLRESLFALET